MTSTVLRPSFQEDSDEQLVLKCAAKLRATELCVAPLGRFGFTGARLFRLHPPRGRVFVLKVHSKKKIEDEKSAIDAISQFFDASLTAHVTHGSHASLLYSHVGGQNVRSANDVVELHDCAYSADFHPRLATAILRKTYATIDGIGSQSTTSSTLMRNYRTYLDRDTLKTARASLQRIFGTRRRDFTFLKARVRDPIAFLEDGRFRRRTDLILGPVHGDLHPKNVLAAKKQAATATLIDFAKACANRHRVIDHVLMECSLRFMVFPSSVNLDEQRRVDGALIEFHGYEGLRRITGRSSLSGPYERLADFLRIIRTSADRFLFGSDQQKQHQYLASQFLMLLRQLAYPDYQHPHVARALGMIAAFLDREWT